MPKTLICCTRLALTALLSLVLGPAHAQALPTVTIATVTWIGFAPFYVAEKLNTFKKYGVSVKLAGFTDNALMVPALQSGAADAAMLTYDQVIGSVAKGMPFRVVLPIDYSAGGDAIIAKKNIKTVAELKGEKIGLNPLSPSDFLLAYALQQNGMTEKDIQPVSMTPEAVPGALASGGLAAGVT